MAYTIKQVGGIKECQFDNSGTHCRFVLEDNSVTNFMKIDIAGNVEYGDKIVSVRLNESYCNGIYRKGLIKVEINTSLSFVSVSGGYNDLYLQGEDADKFIVAVCNNWNAARNKTMTECVFEHLNLNY